MRTPDQPVLRDIVLIGGGHSHVGVLKRFAMKPVPGVRLTLICRDTHTPYSGMLPGYVAGHYSYDDVHIDLSRLAEYAGARFYRAEAIGIDRASKRVICKGRPDVPYDILSINIGSSPRVNDVEGALEYAVPVKPITGFNNRWLALLTRIENHVGPLTIGVVGAGAGGVELTLALQYPLEKELGQRGQDSRPLHLHLFDAPDEILFPPTTPKCGTFSRELFLSVALSYTLVLPWKRLAKGCCARPPAKPCKQTRFFG